ncbi:MAG: hypothetical protein HFI67_07625 [Lachnospiraceae bacterium]|jgi:hypothetical protein|nr:hypothetical protein [Lachnospiraceae bacterium]
MKKRMIAGMMLLVLTVSGCSAVPTVPTELNEPVKGIREETEGKHGQHFLLGN